MSMSKLWTGPYFRVSYDRSGRLKSVADQERLYEMDLRDHRRDWAERDRYREKTGISASTFSGGKPRPEFDRLVADVDAELLDLIWVWEIDRLMRDLEVWVDLRKLCTRRRLKLYVHEEGRLYDFAKRSDVRALTKRAVEAEAYSDKLSENVLRASRIALLDGTPWGRCPYGYRRIYHGRNGRLLAQEADPVTSLIVEEIFRRYASGETVSSIAADLTARGVPRPSDAVHNAKLDEGDAPRVTPWGRMEVNRIATNGAYLGRRTVKHSQLVTDDGTPWPATLDAIWPALVSAEVFEQCLVRKEKDRGRGPKGQTRPGAARWLLSYIAVCANGHAIRVRTTRRHYDCIPGCLSAPVSDVDNLVIATIAEWAARPSVWDAVMVAEVDPAVVQARNLAAELRGELAEWDDLAKRGRVQPATYADHECRLLPLIADAERKASAVTVPGPVAAFLREDDRADLAEARFRALDIAVQRQIVAYVCAVTIHRGVRAKRGDRRYIEFTTDMVSTVPRIGGVAA